MFHTIEWMRAYSRKNRAKQRKKNIKRNYRKVYNEIKWRAKQGHNAATIRFMIYDENITRLKNEGYKVEKLPLVTNSLTSIRW